MDDLTLLTFARDALKVSVLVAGPLLILTLAVGIIVSFLQAITQIQEMSLTFVPKMLLVFGGLLLFGPFMGQTMIEFGQRIYDRILVYGQASE